METIQKAQAQEDETMLFQEIIKLDADLKRVTLNLFEEKKQLEDYGQAIECINSITARIRMRLKKLDQLQTKKS